MERKENLQKLLLDNYMPYGVSTVIERALCRIDGLKPVQKRIIYAMHKDLHLSRPGAPRVKSLRAIGATTPYHPHGDSSIYGAIANMTPDYEGLNMPYIDGKGKFGKVYHNLGPAAARYTEVSLLPICNELLEGLDEDAVDMVPTDDNQETEPLVLPVKFPTILVNSSPGIAVGYSANIPQFPLDRVCTSTIKILKGEITTPAELADTLGIPTYPTGCHVHADKALLTKLCETGNTSILISGTMIPYKDRLEIVEIPPNKTAEEIIEQIENLVKAEYSDEFKAVTEVINSIDKEGFRITIKTKRGTDVRKLATQILNKTDVRCKMHYLTRVIINNRPKDLGLLELLQEWIEFRVNTICRIYRFRLNKKLTEEHLLSSWEVLKGHIEEVVNILTHNKRAEAIEIIKNKFNLDDDQCKYVLDFKLYQLTEDAVEKALKDLENKRKEIQDVTNFLTHRDLQEKLIIEQLETIMKKYKTNTKTTQAEVIDEKVKEEKEPISSEIVRVAITKQGYIRRIFSPIEEVKAPDGDEVLKEFKIKNDSHILAFTYTGDVYKVLVDDIDASKKFKQKLYETLDLSNNNEILLVDEAGDYSNTLPLMYNTGRLMIVPYSKFSGNRQKYVNAYDQATPGQVFIPKSNKSMVITFKHKASLINVRADLVISKNTSSTRLVKLDKDDTIVGLIAEEDLAQEVLNNKQLLNSFNRVSPLAIKNKLLFKTPRVIYTGINDKLSSMIALKVGYDILKEIEAKSRKQRYSPRLSIEESAEYIALVDYFDSEEYINEMTEIEVEINEFRKLITNKN